MPACETGVRAESSLVMVGCKRGEQHGVTTEKRRWKGVCVAIYASGVLLYHTAAYSSCSGNACCNIYIFASMERYEMEFVRTLEFAANISSSTPKKNIPLAHRRLRNRLGYLQTSAACQRVRTSTDTFLTNIPSVDSHYRAHSIINEDKERSKLQSGKKPVDIVDPLQTLQNSSISLSYVANNLLKQIADNHRSVEP